MAAFALSRVLCPCVLCHRGRLFDKTSKGAELGVTLLQAVGAWARPEAARDVGAGIPRTGPRRHFVVSYGRPTERLGYYHVHQTQLQQVLGGDLERLGGGRGGRPGPSTVIAAQPSGLISPSSRRSPGSKPGPATPIPRAPPDPPSPMTAAIMGTSQHHHLAQVHGNRRCYPPCTR